MRAVHEYPLSLKRKEGAFRGLEYLADRIVGGLAAKLISPALAARALDELGFDEVFYYYLEVFFRYFLPLGDVL